MSQSHMPYVPYRCRKEQHDDGRGRCMYIGDPRDMEGEFDGDGW